MSLSVHPLYPPDRWLPCLMFVSCCNFLTATKKLDVVTSLTPVPLHWVHSSAVHKLATSANSVLTESVVLVVPCLPIHGFPRNVSCTIWTYKRHGAEPFLFRWLVSQTVSKFPAFYGTRRYNAEFTCCRHWFISSVRRVNSTPSHHFSLK